jgi:hypothetical protein
VLRSRRFLPLLYGLVAMLAIASCTPNEVPEGMLVYLVADGRERTFRIDETLTVDEFLRQTDTVVSEQDRLTPPRFTQITDGMRITVVRVREESRCEREEIPFARTNVPNEGLASGEERVAQRGQNGVQEVCYRVIFEDDVPGEPIPTGQITVLTEPRDEITYIGIETEVEPVPVPGSLAYLSNGNAWLIESSSTEKRAITQDGNLDSFVFTLSPDGRYLLFTTDADESTDTINELWVMATEPGSTPVRLAPTDVIWAQWHPLRPDTISYSTAEPRQISPFWDALNNVWTMRFDPDTGDALDIEPIVSESSGGLYGWWGTNFHWDPAADRLAVVRADSLGILSPAESEVLPILDYPVFDTSQPWSWRASVSWSPDGALIATTVHGAPLGNEPPERSPVFDIVVADSSGAYVAKLVESAGMWANPKFGASWSVPTEGTSQVPSVARLKLAYLKARNPFNSVTGEYDLVVADSDGSNATVVFPTDASLPGITTSDFGISPVDFVWSPDAENLAVIYQGNLWIVNAGTAVSHQLTFDGGATNPDWVR